MVVMNAVHYGTARFKVQEHMCVQLRPQDMSMEIFF